MNKVLIYSQEDLDLILELEKQENEELQQENKILKENAENNDKVVDKVNWENNLLKQQNKKYKEVIDKMNKLLQQEQDAMTTKFHYDIVGLINALLDILKEVSE